MPTATADLIVTRDWTDPDTGVRWISVPCDGEYDTFRALPQVLRFEGELFARAGWNSDSGRAYYRDRLPVARRA